MCSVLNKNRQLVLKRWKNANATNIFSRENCDFFGVFGWKTGRAGQIILKLSTKRIRCFRKEPRKQNFIAAALHAQIGFWRSDQSQSSTLAQPTNGGKCFLSETIHAQENGSRGTHFAKLLSSKFLKGLTYSAMLQLRDIHLGEILSQSVSLMSYLKKVSASKKLV